MSQIHKLDVQVGIKSSAASFFQVFRSKLNLLPNISPEIVKNVKLIKGDWSVGTIAEWSYVAGEAETARQTVVALDEEKKSITWVVTGGVIDKAYKMLKLTFQVSEGLAKWNCEYEKQSDDVPPPSKYMDLAPVLTKNIDDYLSKNT